MGHIKHSAESMAGGTQGVNGIFINVEAVEVLEGMAVVVHV